MPEIDWLNTDDDRITTFDLFNNITDLRDCSIATSKIRKKNVLHFHSYFAFNHVKIFHLMYHHDK